MSDPLPQKDPRVVYLADALAALWEDMDANPSVAFEAQVSVDALDRWDRENGVQRATAAFVEQLQADLSRTRAALEAAVLAFENGDLLEGRDMGDVVVRASIRAEVAPELVTRWRAIVEGGV